VQGLNLLAGIFVAMLGLAFGSFLNVCIWRLPRHESVAKGRSRCPECGAVIRAMDNVPLLSFLVLRGRCRDCGAGISWRYPAIELATAALWVLCWLEFSLSLEAVGMALFCFLALGLAAMDAARMILPNAFTLPGIVLGLVYSGAMCEGGWLVKLRCGGVALGWAVCAAGLILAIRGLYRLIRRREGMGLGDAKLLAMIAAWLGPANAALAFFLAVVVGAVYGVIALAFANPDPRSGALRQAQGRLRGTRQWGIHRIPLGSFLCAGAIFAAFEGGPVLQWYLRLFE
jgi:leader peptidase (prepilin peptidase) / N-methyltransferase